MNKDSPSPEDSARRCRAIAAMLDAYALDALEPAEASEVAAHLAGCADCRTTLARGQRAVAALGFGVAPVAPPAALRRRLLAKIAGEATTPAHAGIGTTGAVAATPGARTWRRQTIYGLGALAAVLVVGLVVLGTLFHQAIEARDQARADQREFAEYLAGGGLVTPLVPAPGVVAAGQGSLIVAPNQPRAMLLVTGFAVGGGRHYRVWVERGGDRTWVGELAPAQNGTGYLILSAPEPMTAYDTVGIALETPEHPAQDFLLAPVRAPS